MPLHAYRLVYPDRPHGSELLWEGERPSIDRLLWKAKTFGREVVQRYFADWHALAEENRRIWGFLGIRVIIPNNDGHAS
jgi:hypothetical protein